MISLQICFPRSRPGIESRSEKLSTFSVEVTESPPSPGHCKPDQCLNVKAAKCLIDLATMFLSSSGWKTGNYWCLDGSWCAAQWNCHQILKFSINKTKSVQWDLIELMFPPERLFGKISNIWKQFLTWRPPTQQLRLAVWSSLDSHWPGPWAWIFSTCSQL